MQTQSLRSIQTARPTFGDVPAILRDLETVLRSGKLMLGEYLRRFEEEFARSVGCRYAIGVNSCTTALEITLRHLGVEGAEVILPTNTFIATMTACLNAGAKPCLADIDPETLCLGAENLSRVITDRTKAVILVHLGGGITRDLTEVQTLCRRKEITLIEDCAHAHGASFSGTRAGALGWAGCFSFYPTKIMTTGSGGMIATNDEGLNLFARSVRIHGRGNEAEGETDQIERLGNDWFLDEIRSVLGLHQLSQLEENLGIRRALAQRYRERLAAVPEVAPVSFSDLCKPSHYKFMLLAEPSIPVPALRKALWEKHRIETESLYFPPCHLQPVYRRLFEGKEGMFPVAESVLKRQVCLPLHAGMTPEDVEYVVSGLKTELQ